jgi:hypothetical protein
MDLKHFHSNQANRIKRLEITALWDIGNYMQRLLHS